MLRATVCRNEKGWGFLGREVEKKKKKSTNPALGKPHR